MRLIKLSKIFLLASLEEEIDSLGLSKDISDYLNSEHNPQIKGLLFSQIKRNIANISLDLVKQLHNQIIQQLSDKKSKKLQSTDPDVVEIANNISNSSIIHWWTNIVNKKEKLVESLKQTNHFNKQQLIDILKSIEHFYSELPNNKIFNYQDNNVFIDLGQIKFEDFAKFAKYWEDSFSSPQQTISLNQENIKYVFENGYFILELTTEEELKDEGSKLNHCVGGYFSKIQNGESKIFSLRSSSNISEITIETDPNMFQFRQMFGKANAQPNSSQMELINIWKRSLHPIEKILELVNSDNIKDRINAILFMDYKNPEYKLVMDNILLDAKPSTNEFITSGENYPRSEFQAFAQNNTLPENLYEFIYKNDINSISTKYSLAMNNSIGKRLFEELLKDQNPLLIAALLGSRKISDYPEYIKDKTNNDKYYSIIVNNPSIKSSLIRELILQYGERDLFKTYANNLEPKFLNDWVEVYKNNPEQLVKAIQSDNIRKEDLSTIARSLGTNILLTDTKENILANIYMTGNDNIGAIILTPDDPNFPSDKLEELLQDKDVIVRRNAVRNPNFPSDKLILALQDKDVIVRYNAVRNPNFPSDKLILALQDKDEDVRRNAVSNPNFPSDKLEELLQDKDVIVRINAVRNPNFPSDKLILALQDKDVDVRINAVRNPNFPSDKLILALQDKDVDVRINAVRNPNFPSDKLILALQDKDVIVRYNAVRNPNFPSDKLILALQDKDEDVRRNAVSNPNFPSDKLEELLQDKDVDVRTQAKRKLWILSKKKKDKKASIYDKILKLAYELFELTLEIRCS